MFGVREAAKGIAHSEKAAHVAWLLVLLLVESGSAIAGGGGTTGP